MNNAVLTLTIIEMILKYGPQAAWEIANAFGIEEEPTPDEIRELFIDKTPEEYF